MSEQLKQCVSFAFTWHTAGPNPCPKCKALDGKTWFNQTIWQPYLIDDVYGAIWDFNADLPLTHGGLGHNCQCNLEISVDVDATKLTEYQEFTAEVNKALAK